MEEPKKLNLIEYTTIIYAFITFLGYSYIDSYYSFWDINIYSFLDVGEILLSFLNGINFILIVLLLVFLTYAIPIYHTNPNTVKEISIKYLKANPLKAKMIRKVHFLLLILSTILIPLVIYLLFIYSKLVAITTLVTCIIFAIFYLFYIYLPKLLKRLNIDINIHYQRIMFFVAILFVCNYLSAGYKYLYCK